MARAVISHSIAYIVSPRALVSRVCTVVGVMLVVVTLVSMAGTAGTAGRVAVAVLGGVKDTTLGMRSGRRGGASFGALVMILAVTVDAR